MSADNEDKLKKVNLKLKTQTKQLQVVQGIINRTNGFAKSQAQATETRLEKEISELQKNLKSLQGKLKK